MPSPFPGMNPYIEEESLWRDFHVGFLNALKERLVPQVRPRYFVLLERYLYVHEPPTAPAGPRILRDRLPSIPIPLCPPDPDAVVDLQAILDHVHDASGYEDFLHASPPEPPLSAEDAAWARPFLPAMP